MWQNVNEIDEIFESNNYNTNNIITKMFQQFKLNIAFNKYGVEKEQGFSVTEIVFLLLFLPLMGVRTIHHFYKKQFAKMADMQKDTLYRFLDNPNIDWRRILYFVAKQFDSSTGVRKSKECDNKSALIIDDTCFIKTGIHIEKISYVFDHVLKKSFLGFKNLVLSHYDGISYKVLDSSLHCEKQLKKKNRKKQYKSDLDKSTLAFGRRKECDKDKITVAIEMMKRAAKNGFKFKYVIMDSWFSPHKLLKTVRNLNHGSIHAVCAVRKDPRKYCYFGELLNAKQLLAKLQQENPKGKRNRKNNVIYHEAIVKYEGVGNVRLYFAKGSHQRHWKLFLSTETYSGYDWIMSIVKSRFQSETLWHES